MSDEPARFDRSHVASHGLIHLFYVASRCHAMWQAFADEDLNGTRALVNCVTRIAHEGEWAALPEGQKEHSIMLIAVRFSEDS